MDTFWNHTMMADLATKSNTNGLWHLNCDCVTSVIPAGKKGTTEHAAVWVPDSEASTCMHCLKSKFTAINRRVSTLQLYYCLMYSQCLKILVVYF